MSRDEKLNLTEIVNIRVSPDAMARLKTVSVAAGIPVSTWVRTNLYKALGLIKKAK